jgi:hypothetical protein
MNNKMNNKERFRLIVLSSIIFFIFSLNLFYDFIFYIFQLFFGYDKLNTIKDNDYNLTIFGKICLSIIFSIILLLLL